MWGLVGHGRVIHLYPTSNRKPLEGLELEGRVRNRGRRDERLRLGFHRAHLENGLEGLRVNPTDAAKSTEYTKCLHWARCFVLYINLFD